MSAEHNAVIPHPCDSGVQLQTLTDAWSRRFNAESRDLTEEQRFNFLKNFPVDDVDNIRVFRSEVQPGYAVVLSSTFENFLDGKLLVQIQCVKRINGALSIIYDPPAFEELIK